MVSEVLGPSEQTIARRYRRLEKTKPEGGVIDVEQLGQRRRCRGRGGSGLQTACHPGRSAAVVSVSKGRVGHDGHPEETVTEVWERLYTEQGPRWSGRPNQRLVEVVGDLPAGRALDLGCGEGGDAVWLALRGWTVTAVDVSPTALGRLTARADAEGVADRIDTVLIDLATGFPEAPEGGWDLVSAQFFQSTIALPRTAILRRGAEVTAKGGLLLVVEHGEAPAGSNHHDVIFPTVEETLGELDLPSRQWTQVRADRSTRVAEGPDGKMHELVDNVLVLRRV